MGNVNVVWTAICSGLVLSNFLLWRYVTDLRRLLFIHFQFHMNEDPEWGKKLDRFIDEWEE